jgi:eukaryotic-like serine/threonine-protein kinase
MPPTAPRFIETLPKRGYRFIAPVEPLRTASSGAAEIADSTALRLSHALRSSLLPPPKHSFLPSHFAISPDGTALAFVALDQEGRTTLWVRPLSGSRSRRFDATAAAAYPFWSPDSKHIGFFASRKLKVVELSTGIVRTLTDAPVGRGGTWSRDGVILQYDIAADGRFLINSFPSTSGSPLTLLTGGTSAASSTR